MPLFQHGTWLQYGLVLADERLVQMQKDGLKNECSGRCYVLSKNTANTSVLRQTWVYDFWGVPSIYIYMTIELQPQSAQNYFCPSLSFHHPPLQSLAFHPLMLTKNARFAWPAKRGPPLAASSVRPVAESSHGRIAQVAN